MVDYISLAGAILGVGYVVVYVGMKGYMFYLRRKAKNMMKQAKEDDLKLNQNFETNTSEPYSSSNPVVAPKIKEQKETSSEDEIPVNPNFNK